MSRTLNQLDLGTSVYVSESGADVEYILLKKDVEGCILRRAQALEERRINPTSVSVYENSEMDQWLTDEETGYMYFSSNSCNFNTASDASSFVAAPVAGEIFQGIIDLKQNNSFDGV